MHQGFFLTWLLAHQSLAYGAIFVGMLFEGEIVMFSASFLVAQGVLDLLPVVLSAIPGVAIGDFSWYQMGRKYATDESSFMGKLLHKVLGRFDGHIRQRPFRVVFISKFVYGFHHSLLARAGATGFPAKTLFKYDAISSLIWMAIVIALGYFSSASFTIIKSKLKFVEFALLALIITFFVFEKFLTDFMRRRL